MSTEKENEDCENVDNYENTGNLTCSELFNCCDCATDDQDNGCGCRYCFSCNACDACK